MKINFRVDIPFRERVKILWHGRIHVFIDYRGQNHPKPMHVEIGAVNKGADNANEKTNGNIHSN